VFRKAGFAIVLTVSLSTLAAAETPSGTNMQPIAVGDHWTYEIRDNISGDLKGQYTQTVTDADNDDWSVKVQPLGGNASFLTFDHLWNVKVTPIAKFAPNDGTGVKDQMKAGDTWSGKASDIRSSRTLWKRTETSKVLDEEQITTQAGTFNAVKYETTIEIRSAIDPTKKATTVVTTWYVPSVNHWVKRTEKSTSEDRVRSNASIELVEYGRQ
jgi:hypothetical protein